MSLPDGHAWRVLVDEWDGRVELVERPAWQARAACRGLNPDTFFASESGDGRWIDDAKKICATCQVSNECLEYALSQPSLRDTPGVWGGTTGRERLRIRRQRAR